MYDSRCATLVLVADDDGNIRTLMATVLSELGVGVLLAGDGATAVHLALDHRAKLCCVILDLRMPVLDGLGRPGRSGRASAGWRSF